MEPIDSRFERRKRESRQRILDAAFALFREQGLDATTLDQICERADVANRTFFNHFPRREHMVRALALERLRNLAVEMTARRAPERTAPDELVVLFDDIGAYLESAGAHYRELVGAMLVAAGGRTLAGVEHTNDLFVTLLALIKEGVGAGEISADHDPSTLADIVIGGLVVALMNWTSDATYNIRTGLHSTAVALADLLTPVKHSKNRGRR